MTTTKRLTNSRVAYSTHLVFTLCALCVLCGYSSAQDFKKVHDGVEHAQVEYKIGEDPLKINLLRLDLKKVRLDVHHALDKAIGLETTSSIATRKNAVAAINAGFFRLDKSEYAGDASDYLVIDGDIISEGNRGRAGVEFHNGSKETKVAVRQSNLNAWLGSLESRFITRLSGVNRPPAENEMILFTAMFGRSTRIDVAGTAIILNDCSREKKWKSLVQCRSVSIQEGAADVQIPRSGYVVWLSPEKFRDKQLVLNEIKVFQAASAKKKAIYLKIEDGLNPSYNYTVEQDVIAGVPQLIKNGKIDITWEQEKASKSFAETRHPRTAVAKLNDGKFLMMTVDGRQPGVSVGMSLRELAEYLLSIGAVDAMNLDGGGSTTMVLDGKVVNKPSDKEGERKIGDAIVVTLRKKK